MSSQHARCLETPGSPVVDTPAIVIAGIRIDVGLRTVAAMNTATGFSDPLVSDTPLPFHDLCARIHDRISAFLDAKNVPERVRSVQEQTRVAVGVIDQALARYRSVARHIIAVSHVKLTVTEVCRSCH